jgi:hypothetical protein
MEGTIVGLQRTTLGVSDGDIPLTIDSAQYIMPAHLRNVEAVRAARIFSACTGAAGVAPGTALGTAPPLTLYNPQGSSVGLAIHSIRMGYLSGTLAAGLVALVANPSLTQAAPSGGTALTARCAFVGYSAGQGQAYQGSTLDATSVIVLPLFSFGPVDGSDKTFVKLEAELEGAYMIAPGCSMSLQGIAGSGTSPLVLFGMTWEEVRL